MTAKDRNANALQHIYPRKKNDSNIARSQCRRSNRKMDKGPHKSFMKEDISPE
jgi:hypothetical protein